MYCQFYGFREKPFSLLPDPEFLFLSSKHEKALNLLELGILNQSGFCVISGEIGAGKTTLVRELLNRLDEHVSTGLIANTHSTFSDLLGWILAAYELKCDSNEVVIQHRCFTDFVIAQYARGKHTLLIIDEAQNLSLSALEQLRMLSNINSDKDLVLQIILVGQSELRTKLQQPALEQFAQRIAIDYHLTALDQQETNEYIIHRVRKSGGTQQLFDEAACRLVFQRSGGIPRLINRICDLSLVYGFSESKKIIDAALVEAVTAQQNMDRLIATPAEKPADTPLAATPVLPAIPSRKTAVTREVTPEPAADLNKDDIKPAANGSIARAAEPEPERKAAASEPVGTADKKIHAPLTQKASAAIYAAAKEASVDRSRTESIAIEKNSAVNALLEKSKADVAFAKKANAEKLAAEKEAQEKTAAEQAATALAEASMAAVKQAQAEKLAAEQSARKAALAAEQAAGIITRKKQTAEKLITEKARIEEIALQEAAAAKAAAEKAVAERIAAEKAAAEIKAAAEAAVRKAAANRAAAEKVATSMVQDSEAAAARTLSRQADAARTAAEKADADKAATEKAHANAALAEKAAAAKAVATAAAREKTMAAKQAAQKVAASRAAAKKALAEKNAADTIARQKASLEKIALAKVAVSVAAAAQQAADRAAAARSAAQKEARDKEAAAIAAARKAAEASALAEAAAAASGTRTNVSDLQLVEKPDGEPATVSHQSPAAMQAQIQAARTTPWRARTIVALSAISALVAASAWLGTRPGDMGTTLNALVVAGQSFVNPAPVTETAALKPDIEVPESPEQP